MGFTNVAWESRSAEQLARDLTDGPGPVSVGRAGAAWVRVADEWASISQEFDKILDRIKSSFASQGADAAARKLEEFGQWLQSVGVAAALNGQRAEEAGVAYSVAVLGMPSVSEVMQARTTHDIMSSLAAYNGALLTGQFAEFDETVTAHQATASTVMYQYEQACDAIAEPWQQPVPPHTSTGAALKAERQSQADGEHAAGGAGGPGAALVPMPLAPFRAAEVRSTSDSKASHTVASAGVTSGGASVGPAGYGPMAALARGSGNTRDHHSMLADTLDGGGEPGAGLSEATPSWLPASQHNEAPFTVAEVSWGPNASVFDELATPAEPELPQYAESPEPTLEQVSNRWVAPPVIGADKGLTL